ncbi:MAG: hypothetical protein WD049_08275 [Candidatus Paceibacterota bacterium]
MNVLQLRGLSGSNPLGAMAAFGLLRILSIDERFAQDFGQAKLKWSFALDWIPELHVERKFELEQLINYLIDKQTERCSLLFREGWRDDIKCAPGVFRELWESVLHQFATGSGTCSAFELAAFLAAYGSEVIKDKKAKPDVKPTAFHMTAGQQRFLKSAKDIADSLDPNQLASKRQKKEARMQELGEAYRVALNGPWPYQDDYHSLGWDPATEGLYALSDSSPSDAGARSVRAAVWLAFESLPLFPSVPIANRLHTTGFDRSGRAFSWPIWEPPIGLETLRIMLGSTEFDDSAKNVSILQARGICTVMRSQCVRDANGRGTFRNSTEHPIS